MAVTAIKPLLSTELLFTGPNSVIVKFVFFLLDFPLPGITLVLIAASQIFESLIIFKIQPPVCLNSEALFLKSS